MSPQLHADWLHIPEAHHEAFLDADLGHVEGDALCWCGHHAGGAVSLALMSLLLMVSLSLSAEALVLLLQTPEVQNVLQTAEEPEQRGEEQGGAGRSPRQRLQGAAAAHAASGGRPVMNSAHMRRLQVFYSLRLNTRQHRGTPLIATDTRQRLLIGRLRYGPLSAHK